MKKKRPRRDYAPQHEGHSAPPCAVPGCPNEGEYKAPKSRDNLREYIYLCLDHIREHNLKWNYFEGMGREQIEEFMADAVTGHRPTWEREARLSNAHEKLHAALDDFIMPGRRKTKANPSLPSKVQKALALFEIDYPYTHDALRNQYKKLVKRYHPDKNQGDTLAEEKFKAVANAYKVLEKHLGGE